MKKIFVFLICFLIASPSFAFNKHMKRLQKSFKNSELVTIKSYRAFDFYSIQEGWHKESPSEFEALIIYPKGEGPFPLLMERKVGSVSRPSCLIKMMKLKFLIKIGIKD